MERWPTTEWQTAAPADVGIDRALSARLAAAVVDQGEALTSAIVVRGGRIAVEHYSGGAGPDTLHDVYSITKSVVSALVGVAMARGRLAGTRDHIATILPGYAEHIDGHPVTLGHFLTMSSGLDVGAHLGLSDDAVATALSLPPIAAPGTSFEYSDHCARVVSAAVGEACGMSAAALAREAVFDPIGVGAVRWPDDGRGRSRGGSGLAWTTRDMARFGYLYLRGGRWGARQLIPAAWVAESTRPHQRGGPPVGHPYGYLWWIDRDVDGAFFAAGLGGQLLFVAPALDLVVAMTAGPRGASSSSLLRHVILPAVD